MKHNMNRLGSRRPKRQLALLLGACTLVLLGAAAPLGGPLHFDEAEIFIEINATDGDAGIQVKVDGEDWEKLRILNPAGRLILEVEGEGAIADQGLTELFFESAEPSFDEQTLEELLEMFPEGGYRVLGRTTEGDRIVAVATLTHDIPAQPEVISPEEDDIVDPGNTVIMWNLVEDPRGIEIISYEVIVEREDPLRVFTVQMPPTATSVSVPPEFMDPGTEYKVEVIAKEDSGNQTITEVAFFTMP